MAWRYFLAIFLSGLVLTVWMVLYPPQPPRPRPQPVAPAPAAEERAGGAESPARDPDEARVVPAPEPAPVRVERPEKSLTIELSAALLHATGSAGRSGDSDGTPPRIRYTAHSTGGVVRDVWLPEFGQQSDRNEPYRLLYSAPPEHGLLGLQIDGVDIEWRENWELESTVDNGVTFRNEIDDLRIQKTIGTPANEIPLDETPVPEIGLYYVPIEVTFTNDSDEPREMRYTLNGPASIGTEAQGGRSLFAPGGDIALATAKWAGGRVVAASVEAGDVIDRPTPAPAWVGARNNYFAALLFPLPEVGKTAAYVERSLGLAYTDPRSVEEIRREGGDPSEAYRNVATKIESAIFTLPAGAQVVHRYGLFLGPRDRESLSIYESLDLSAVNDYFVLTRLFVWFLDVLNKLAFGSWGVAIILLTIIVRLLLHPLSKKSQKNMHRFSKKMQKVKPQMTEIQQKYKDNRMKQNQEVHKLFKEHGINPAQQMGGCLLILLQMPIWIALYRTLYYSIGLRQASFLWIEDLTRADHLFPFISSLPLVGDMFAYFNILPVLYVIFTIINQRLQPKPDDPQMRAQYQMMTFMMVFFGLIFYNFPSGFMLYIMTSTLLGIFESKMIKAELAREEEAAGTQSPEDAGDGTAAVAATAGGALYPAQGGGGASASSERSPDWRAKKRKGKGRKGRK